LVTKSFYYHRQQTYSELFTHKLRDAQSSIYHNGIGIGSNLDFSLANVLGRFQTRRLGQGVIVKAQSALRTTRYAIYPHKESVQEFWRRLYEVNGYLWWKRVWQGLYTKNMLYKPVLPPFGLVVRAVSLSFSRSHLTLGLVALAIGSMNGCPAKAQPFLGNGSAYCRSEISPAFFSAVIYSIVGFLAIIVRALYLLTLFAPVVLASIVADSLGDRFRKAWLRLMRHTLELAGAAFIKWGQWAATRPDLFPRDLCLELSKLHMKAPTHKYSYTAQTVEKAFGRKLQDIFEEFEEDPVASGSIAQVHRATLRFHHPGRKSNPMLVAVKVRHPGVVDMIRQDFVIINWIARLCTLAPGLKWLRLNESVQQFAVFMQTQVDLAWEAAHLSRFLYNFRQSKDVSFPKPLYPLVHPAVLVETYEKGESVSRFVELSEKSHINSALARIGTNTLLKMLLVCSILNKGLLGIVFP
jgi:aarF domain-containing kinase